VEIGVAGAGGIGSYYAGLLSRAGQRVRLIARGEHLAAIEANGLEVRTPNERFVAKPEVTSDVGRLVGCEYVIVAVKGYSLGEIGPALAAAAASGAAIVPLLNGIDVPDRLEALGIPRASIIGGLVAASLVRFTPGIVERRSPFDRMALGELDRAARPRTRKLVDAMVAAGTEARVSSDIVLDLWRKFAFIVPMTVACGLSRQPMGAVLATERGRALVTGALHEIVLVSRACGAFLADDDESKVSADLLGVPAAIRPSFLQDLERGGPTELDLLAGAVSRLGRECSVATPIHDVATAAFESATRPPS
jgi:2-dehydropantoate 2-reductase